MHTVPQTVPLSLDHEAALRATYLFGGADACKRTVEHIVVGVPGRWSLDICPNDGRVTLTIDTVLCPVPVEAPPEAPSEAPT